MRKTILFLGFLAFCSVNTQAQEVYNYLVKKATEKINSPYTNDYELKKYEFELTALNYIKNYAFKTNRSITTTFLDEQAYYLDCFILAYMKQSSNRDKNQIKNFISASLENPLFNDSDAATTQAYINEEGSLFPFSIDTDWIKAYQTIKEQ